MAHVALQHIGFEQGVVRDAAQGHAVVGEHMLVILEVLPELSRPGILQPGAQQLEGARDAELLGHAGAAVRKRQVGGAARFD